MTDIPDEMQNRRAEDDRLTRLEKRVDQLADGVQRIIEIADKAEAAIEYFNWCIDKLRNGIDRLAGWIKPIAVIATSAAAIYHIVTGNLAAAWKYIVELLK